MSKHSKPPKLYHMELECQICGSTFISKRLGGDFTRPAKYCTKCRSKISQKAKAQNRIIYAGDNDNRYIDSGGYVKIKVDGVFVAEHRYIMEQILGRKLLKGEIVHHKDGDKRNNHPSNLELWFHPHLAGIRLSDFKCPHCGKSYFNSPHE